MELRGHPAHTKIVAVIVAALLSPEWRHALEELANASERGGATEAVLLARGFTAEMAASLVLSGLAETSVETLKVGGRGVEVVRMRIMDAGQFALNNN